MSKFFHTSFWILIIGCFGLAFLSTVSAESVKEGQVQIFDVVSGKDIWVDRVVKTETQWKKELSKLQYYITRQEGTERAFSGEYDKNKAKGIYRCVACGTDLYDSKTKFDSGTGWPSFWQAVSDKNVTYHIDRKLFIPRVEVECARCGAHLGHVFEDGPRPTGKRHCINSAALKFEPTE